MASGMLPVQHDFSDQVKKGQGLYLRDGQIQTEIISVQDRVVTAKAKNSGKVLSDHGINLPDTEFRGGVLTQKDKKDLLVINKLDADYVAVSFAHTAADIVNVRKEIAKHKVRCQR